MQDCSSQITLLELFIIEPAGEPLIAFLEISQHVLGENRDLCENLFQHPYVFNREQRITS